MATTQMEAPSQPADGNQRTTFIFVGIVAFIFTVLGIWGGLPPEGERLAFVGGVLFLISMVAVTGVAVWHLMLRPMPEAHRVIAQPLINPAWRQLLAAMLALSGISLTLGAFWDEMWHRDFGIPFGEDFFWRPHLLMYGAFLLVIFLALGGWFTILRKGRGSLQQRFRMDPVLSYVTLFGTFLIYSLPFDPLWHAIYGEDLSAWSIPHVILSGTFALTLVMFMATQLSILPERDWRTIFRPDFATLGLVLILSFAVSPLVQLIIIEWSYDSLRDLVYARPDWLLPALIAFVASFVSYFATHSLKRLGVATLIVTLAFVVRMIFVALGENPNLNAKMWGLIIPVAVGIDLFYLGFDGLRGQRPHWAIPAAAGSALAMVVIVPLINAILVAPTLEVLDLLLVFPMAMVGGLTGAWLGMTMGRFASQMDNQTQEHETQLSRVRLAMPALGVAYVLFIAWFMMTATPPVA